MDKLKDKEYMLTSTDTWEIHDLFMSESCHISPRIKEIIAKLNRLYEAGLGGIENSGCSESIEAVDDVSQEYSIISAESWEEEDILFCESYHTSTSIHELNELRKQLMKHNGEEEGSGNSASNVGGVETSLSTVGELQINKNQRPLVHHSKKTYQCETCGKGFTQLSTLQTHSLTHGSAKRYQCTTCGEKYVELDDMKQHCLTHRK